MPHILLFRLHDFRRRLQLTSFFLLFIYCTADLNLAEPEHFEIPASNLLVTLTSEKDHQNNSFLLSRHTHPSVLPHTSRFLRMWGSARRVHGCSDDGNLCFFCRLSLFQGTGALNLLTWNPSSCLCSSVPLPSRRGTLRRSGCHVHPRLLSADPHDSTMLLWHMSSMGTPRSHAVLKHAEACCIQIIGMSKAQEICQRKMGIFCFTRLY